MSQTDDIFDGVPCGVPTDSVEIELDPTGGSSLSATVVMAVAAATATDPREVERLGAVVDPDALDILLRGTDPERSDLEVSFTLEGCRVTVRGDGWVLVRNPDA